MLECDEWADLYRSVSYGAELGNFGGEGFSGIFCMGLKGSFGVFFANSSVEQLDVEKQCFFPARLSAHGKPDSLLGKIPGVSKARQLFLRLSGFCRENSLRN